MDENEVMRDMLRKLKASIAPMIPEDVRQATYAVQGATHVAAILMSNSTFDINDERDVDSIMGLIASAGGQELKEMGSDYADTLMRSATEHFREAYDRAVKMHATHEAGQCECQQQPERERDSRAPSIEKTKEMFGGYL